MSIADTTNQLVRHARELLDANRYLTLSTIGADGRPWTSPVYFAAAGVRDYYWISETDADHSRNLTDRPHVSFVVFDSSVQPYFGRAVYAVATARVVPDEELDDAFAAYPGPSDRGAMSFVRDDVTGESPYRLYRATASSVWVLCPREPRRPCTLHGLAKDHRAQLV